MKNIPHIIEKLCIEFQVSDKNMALADQDRMCRLFRNKLASDIDDIMSSFGSEDFVSIERMEVELEMNDLNGLEKLFAMKFTEQLRKVCNQQRHHDKGKAPVSRYSKHPLMVFLETGNFPIAGSSPTPRELFEGLLAQEPEVLINYLFSSSCHELARRRMVLQMTFESVEDYLLLLLSPHQEKILTALKTSGAWKGEDFRRRSIELLLEIVRKRNLQDKSAEDRLIRRLRAFNRQRVVLSVRELDALFYSQQRDDSVRFANDNEDIMIPGEDRKEKSQTVKRKAPQSGEDIYVSNAGLVLLSPYYAQLFSTLGLTENSLFVTEEAQRRAVHLLGFIATGEERASENKLLFNKIICGISVEELLEYDMKLLEREKAECMELMEAAILHWNALKRTSAKGFRDAFLQREGKLSFEANGYSVRIQREPYDILLDRLPWNISTVKLPWNNYFIHVIW